MDNHAEDNDFSLDSYDYHLPSELIAQYPLDRRDASRLLVLDRARDSMIHSVFREITSYLREGDLLVVNDTKVFSARLVGETSRGKTVEVLLLGLPDSREEKKAIVSCLVKNARRFRTGETIRFGESLQGEVTGPFRNGEIRLSLSWEGEIAEVLANAGQVPLPPYIRRNGGPAEEDLYRYQTVYARHPGSVAAPTAGLHFSEDLMDGIKCTGVGIAPITLHVGYGTFAPVRSEDLRRHKMHEEFYSVSAESADRINETKKNGNKVVAVGTTAARAVESSAVSDGRICRGSGFTNIFIYPGYRFKIVDHLITNFHLPRSTLLMLVSAFAGREKTLRAYKEAVKRQYRFFSYGDAMLIL
ncbi:MAG: tRNA preQ1(34) S-adenosylmethionine ribosyltransferase-isomerase QueA [Pseudomonadota bacterium]